jgi:hypothetical protein
MRDKKQWAWGKPHMARRGRRRGFMAGRRALLAAPEKTWNRF